MTDGMERYLTAEEVSRRCHHDRLLARNWGDGAGYHDSLLYICEDCRAGLHVSFTTLYEFDRQRRIVRVHEGFELAADRSHDDRTIGELFAFIGVSLVAAKPY